MQRPYYVYILASRSRNLYAGVTNNLWRRVFEHRESQIPGFTKKYRIRRLVHFEVFSAQAAVLTLNVLNKNVRAIESFDRSSEKLSKRIYWVVLTAVIGFFTVLLWRKS